METLARKQSSFPVIPELDDPMPQGNSYPVELISDVPPQPSYIHQLKTRPNPEKAKISQATI